MLAARSQFSRHLAKSSNLRSYAVRHASSSGPIIGIGSLLSQLREIGG
jgi:hypothetical protein